MGRDRRDRRVADRSAAGGSQGRLGRYDRGIDDDRHIRDNPEASRFELWLGGRLAGVVDYRVTDDTTVAVLHVEVAPDLRGQGVSDRFFGDVLAQLRAREMLVTPICGWARHHMRTRPEYQDLLASP